MSEPDVPSNHPRRIPSPERKWTERPQGPSRDIDSAQRMFRIKAIMWGVFVTVITFFVSNIAAAVAGIGPPVLYFIWLGGLVAGVATSVMALRVSSGGAAVMGKIHHPSGKSTPAVREYSHAQSLAKRGRYSEAVDAYQLAIAEFPDDAEPYIRVARMYRDHLREPEQALRWFKRARAEAAIVPGRELVVTQEIIELYRRHLGTPRKALPELARLIERFPDHPHAAAAKRELEELRAEIRAEDA